MNDLRFGTTLLCLLLLGCKTGTIELDEDDDDGGGDDTGLDGDGGASGDGGDGGATGDGGDGGTAGDGGGTGGDGGGDGGGTGGDGGGSTVDYTGIYQGPLSMMVLSEWGDYDLGDCDTTLTVDTSGAVAGAATCSTGGWGGDTFEVPVTGEVSSDGQVQASAPVDLGWSGAVDVELTGQIDNGGEMALEAYGALSSDWGTTELVGEGTLQRQ